MIFRYYTVFEKLFVMESSGEYSLACPSLALDYVHADSPSDVENGKRKRGPGRVELRGGVHAAQEGRRLSPGPQLPCPQGDSFLCQPGGLWIHSVKDSLTLVIPSASGRL